MTAPYLSINGARANVASLRVPFAGRWIADVDYDGTVVPSGKATIQIGSVALVGTVVQAFTGVFVGHVKARVVAGAGGWAKVVSPKSYHDDGGVRRADVIAAIAREVGETVDTSTDKVRLPVDFVRLAEPASRALEGALGSVPWRVDFDGVTRYGDRPAGAIAAGAELLEVDPRTKVMTFGALDPSSVPIGARVADAKRMTGALVVHELELRAKAGATRIHAWGVAA